MSRRIAPRVPTQCERARAIVAGLGTYSSALARLDETLAEDRPQEGGLTIVQWRACENLRRAAAQYESALKRALETLKPSAVDGPSERA